MSETISACENVFRDFGWLPPVWTWLAQTVQQLGPALTLMGAVFLYFRKERADQQAEMRRVRSQLFSRFLAEANAVWDSITEGQRMVGGASKLIRLDAIRLELKLLAGEEVNRAGFAGGSNS